MSNRVVILGAGPAGLWTALTLLEDTPGLDVTVIEEEQVPGGITGSFEYRGITFDYGSHRLHPSTSPEILAKIGAMLGDDLLKRPRNGRIWLEGRFISFPLKPHDLLLNLPPSFSLGFAKDMLMSPFRSGRDGATFEDTLIAGLGRTISSRFYFPYARKLWGLPPEELSPVQARKRIASGSTWKMLLKALSSLSGSKAVGGYYFYPGKGFGQIAERTAQEAVIRGARIMYGSPAVSLRIPDDSGPGAVVLQSGTGVPADFLFSTIPLRGLMEIMGPGLPQPVAEAASGLSSRSMVFLCLEVRGSRFTRYDAHYFPGPGTCFSRMSEPKNYSMSDTPGDRTGLCFEIPCGETDKVWEMDDGEILKRVLKDLGTTGLPAPEVLSSTVGRKRNVYPVYDLEFASRLSVIEDYLDPMERLVTLGRQGLFVHDNTHHTIEMGIAAGRCLGPDLRWDRDRWEGYRRLFESHVVVD
jgi:protoporphyrinogen oxidase